MIGVGTDYLFYVNSGSTNKFDTKSLLKKNEKSSLLAGLSFTKKVKNGVKLALNMFKKIETLIVNSYTNEKKLSKLEELKYVKHIDVILCNIQVDLIVLKTYFSNLEPLHISNMKKQFGLQLKQLNPDIYITSNSFDLE